MGSFGNPIAIGALQTVRGQRVRTQWHCGSGTAAAGTKRMRLPRTEGRKSNRFGLMRLLFLLLAARGREPEWVGRSCCNGARGREGYAAVRARIRGTVY